MSRRRREHVAGALLIVGLTLGSGCDGEIRLGDENADGGSGADVASAETRSSHCTRDGDCEVSSLHCDVASGSCVACTADAQCTQEDLRRCDGATHRCVECGVSADCRSSALVCEPMTRKCVPGCAGGAQCPEDARTCDVGRSICVACTVDASCMSGDRPHCENSSGRCVECSDDAHCAREKPRCAREIGRCSECLSAPDCPIDKPICDPGSRACIQTDH